MNFIKLTQSAFKSVFGTVAVSGEKIGEATTNTGQVMQRTTAGAAEVVSSAVSNATKTVTELVVKTGETVGGAVAQGGNLVIGTAVGIGEGVVNTASQATKTVTHTALKTGETIGGAVAYGGNVVVEAAVGVKEGVVNTASQATKAVTENVTKAGEAINDKVVQTKKTLFLFVYITTVVLITLLSFIVGFCMAYINNKPEVAIISLVIATAFLFFAIVFRKQALKIFSSW